jgi:protein phosphatase
MDVPFVLALIVVVAGVAYQLWARARRLAGKATAAPPPAVVHDRRSETIPPTLRPKSELSPKMAAKLSAGSDGPAADAERAPAEATSDAPRQEAAAPPPSSRELPKLSVAEDDELEPTKIGEVTKAAAIQPVVEKIVFDPGADAPPAGPAPALEVYALGATDPGKRRKQNQDAFASFPESSVFVVADGMGGHRGGQHASRLAVETIASAFSNRRFAAAPHEGLPLEASELARAVQMANTAIFEQSQRQKDLEGMGTTLVAARFTGDRRRMYIAHVGDSRAYRVRDGVMKQITSDHTMADYGVTGPEGSHLSRAIGVWPTVPIDLIMLEPKLGDLYLICSDGLTKMIPETTIATQLLHEDDAKAAVDRLIFFANAHGGKDNITVLLVRVVERGWAPPPAS